MQTTLLKEAKVLKSLQRQKHIAHLFTGKSGLQLPYAMVWMFVSPHVKYYLKKIQK